MEMKKSQFSSLHRSDLTPSSFSVPLSKGKKSHIVVQQSKGLCRKKERAYLIWMKLGPQRPIFPQFGQNEMRRR
jgi:hypothetical protein